MRILAGVRGAWSAFMAPEVADRAPGPGEHPVAGHIGVLSTHVVAGVLATRVGVQLQIPPSAFACVVDDALDRRAGHHREGGALLDVGNVAVPRTHRRGAHRAALFAVGPIHEAVDDQGVLVTEQVGEGDGTVRAVAVVLLGDLATRGQRPALLGDTFDVTTQFDFLSEQRGARPAVLVALIGKADGIVSGQLPRRWECLVDGHRYFSLLGRQVVVFHALYQADQLVGGGSAVVPRRLCTSYDYPVARNSSLSPRLRPPPDRLCRPGR